MEWYAAFVVAGIALLLFFVWLSYEVAKAAGDDHQ